MNSLKSGIPCLIIVIVLQSSDDTDEDELDVDEEQDDSDSPFLGSYFTSVLGRHITKLSRMFI